MSALGKRRFGIIICRYTGGAVLPCILRICVVVAAGSKTPTLPPAAQVHVTETHSRNADNQEHGVSDSQP